MRILVFLLLGLAAVSIFYLVRNSGPVPSSPETVNVSHSPTVAPPHPLSIFALKQRTYPSGQITTVRQVVKNPKFTSFVVTYSSDGLTQYALMNVPIGTPPAAGWPVVIVNHGHIDPEVYSTENSYINTSAYFANAGFLVLKPDFRGHDNSQGEADKLVSRIYYAVDVLHLLASLSSLPQVNPEQVFMYGHSMGGDVTLRILEVSDYVRAATLWAPAVTDFPASSSYFARRRSPERAAEMQAELEATFKPEEYTSVGPLYHTNLVQVPVNIHHSTTDESVPYQWGQVLADKLTASGVKVNFYTYPGDNHDIAGNWSTALNRDIQLFKSLTMTASP